MLSRAFSVVRTLVSWSYMGVMTVVFMLVMLLVFPSRRLRICTFNLWGLLTCGIMAAFAGARLPRGLRARFGAVHPAIFVSNHTSYLDNFIATGHAPIGTLGMAQSGTLWVPFFGQIYALGGHVLVNRRDKRAAATALRTMIDLMQKYRLSAMIWPEGGRSSDGRLQPFKRGFGHIALATRFPIVPIVVSNAHRCWPKGTGFTRFARVDVQVLEPISTTDWTAKHLDVHVAEVWSRIADALPADQKPADPVTAESPR